MSDQIGKGKPGPGRPKGSASTKTKVAKILKRLKFEPIKELVDLAQDPKTPVRTRADILKELATYLHPKQKAADTSGDQTAPVSITLNMDGKGTGK